MSLSESRRDDVEDVIPRALPPDPDPIRAHTSADEHPVVLEPIEDADRQATGAAAAVRPTARFMRSHLAHALALAFGAGLSPFAAGTVGTLWAWLVWALLISGLSATAQGVVIGVTLLLSVWASTVTARNLRTSDPGAIVIDEVVAFWIVLWLISPATLWAQCVAFGLFRFFDAAKPGPVGWADRLLHGARGWLGGVGIVLDDVVAAFCTLLVIALWRVL